MPVIAECRRCLTRSQFPTELAGHKVPCPHCGKRIRLPALQSFPAVPPPGMDAGDPLAIPSLLSQFRKRRASTADAEEAADTGAEPDLQEREVASPVQAPRPQRPRPEPEAPEIVSRAPVEPLPARRRFREDALDDEDEAPAAAPRFTEVSGGNTIPALSLLLASLSFMLSSIPHAETPSQVLALLGCVLGLAALGIGLGLTGRLAFPCLSLGLSCVAVFCTVVLPRLPNSAQTRDMPVPQPSQLAMVLLENPNAPGSGAVPSWMSRPVAINERTWVDASTSAVQLNSVRVRIVGVIVVQPMTPVSSDTGPSPERVQIDLRLLHLGKGAPIAFQRWVDPALALGDPPARLTDDENRLYEPRSNALSPAAAGQFRQGTLNPGKTLDDQLFFEAPPPTIRSLHLELSAAAFGGSGKFRFRIPAAMIRR